MHAGDTVTAGARLLEPGAMALSRSALALLLFLGCRSDDRAPSVDSNGTVEVVAVSAVTSGSAASAPVLAAATRSYEIRVGNNLLGEMTMEWTPKSGGGYRLTSTSIFKMKTSQRGGTEQRSEVESVDEYAADLALLSSKQVTKEGAIEERESTTITAGSLRAVVEKPSHSADKTLPLPADWSNEVAVFQSLRTQAAAGATLPLSRRYMSFDSEDMAFTPHTVTIEGRTKVDAPSGPIDGWKIKTRDEKEGEELSEVRDDIGLPLSAELGTVTVVLKGTPGGGAGVLEVDSTLPVDGSLAAGALTALVEVTITGDAAKTDPIFSSSPYQAVERRGDVYALTLSSRRRATAAAAPALPISDLPPEVARFLGPTARSQSTEPAIIAKSKEIVSDEKDSDKAARKIVRWVYQKLEKRDGARGAASAVETLKANAGDCTEHTVLTIALARAAGIPARAAGGIVLIPGSKTEAGYHAWPELWVGEWVVMDPALGQLEAGPRYLFLGYDEPGEVRGEGKLVRLLGRTKLRIK